METGAISRHREKRQRPNVHCVHQWKAALTKKGAVKGQYNVGLWKFEANNHAL